MVNSLIADVLVCLLTAAVEPRIGKIIKNRRLSVFERGENKLFI